MALKVDLRHFLDEEGSVLELTEQAKTVFTFLTKIVSSVSEKSVSEKSDSQEQLLQNIAQPFIDVDLKCNTRADELSCCGHIEANCSSINVIEWHCDTCKATGTISNWQGSSWDKQARTLH